MRITARVDYAIRAALELAAAAPEALTSDRIAGAQGIPARFLQAILRDLQGARLVSSQRGRELEGGADGVFDPGSDAHDPHPAWSATLGRCTGSDSPRWWRRR